MAGAGEPATSGWQADRRPIRRCHAEIPEHRWALEPGPPAGLSQIFVDYPGIAMSKRIAVFVDVQNIYYTTRHAYGRQFDYRKLWQRISTGGEIVYATAYATDRGDDKQRKFQSALKHIGFTVKLKPYIQRSDGSAKGDWDVGITIDVMEIAKDVDRVILLSGDGDFDLLLEKIKVKYGVSAEVYSVPVLTADSLIAAASMWHPIDEDLLL
jgi:uncharacterized LabA/DUF88 family protein